MTRYISKSRPDLQYKQSHIESKQKAIGGGRGGGRGVKADKKVKGRREERSESERRKINIKTEE